MADGDEGAVASIVTVRVFVNYNGPTVLENVALVAACTAPIFLATDTVVLPSLASGNRTPTIVPFTFRCRVEELPVDLSVAVVATYMAVSGEPRCARCDVLLPFGLVCSPIPPVKSPKYRITFESSAMPPPLPALFEDVFAKAPALADAAAQAGVSAMSVQYLCGLDATVLVSKNAGRYRIQSNSFEGLWLLSQELVRRLSTQQGGSAASAEGAGGVTFTEPLPLQEYFELVDEHLRCRNDLAKLNEVSTPHAHAASQPRSLAVLLVACRLSLVACRLSLVACRLAAQLASPHLHSSQSVRLPPPASHLPPPAFCLLLTHERPPRRAAGAHEARPPVPSHRETAAGQAEGP